VEIVLSLIDYAMQKKDAAEIFGPSGTFLHAHTIAWKRDAL
jgi:hypothetical protein